MEQTKTRTDSRVAGGGALMATRTLSGVVATLVFVQGTLAGAHLSGESGALGIHGTVGTVLLPLLTIGVIVTAAAAARHNRWVLPAGIFGFLATGMQIGMGYQDRLNIHVPLGIALFGIYLSMALLAKRTTTTDERTTT